MKKIKIHFKSTVYGVAMGNNAAWLCPCGNPLPLIASTSPNMKRITTCPKCKRTYKPYPRKKTGIGQPISHVDEIGSGK